MATKDGAGAIDIVAEPTPTSARPGFYTEAYPDPADVTIAGLSRAAEDQEALAVEHGEMAESVRALLAAVQRLVAENARLAAEVRTLRAGRQVQIYGGYGNGIPEARAVALRDLAGEAGELNDMEAGE